MMNTLYRVISIYLLILLWLPLSLQAQDSTKGQIYIIQSGDTLWKVAARHLGDGNLYPLIVEATRDQASADASFQIIHNPNLIVVGQKVWIPHPSFSSSMSSPTSEKTRKTESETMLVQGQSAPSVTSSTAQSVECVSTTSGLSGHIAFSFWNNHPDRCTYEINIINVAQCLAGPAQCQASRRIFGLNNLSEPALSPDGQRLAFRGWGEPPSEDSPYRHCAAAHPHRYLGQTTLDGTTFRGLGGFWEDSHPDWSPDGGRIIFDTTRNGDDISRILFINADGSQEENPLIAGQQPSWAADGQRFVYRGCDLTGNRCGLWQALAVPMLSWNTGQNMLGPILEEAEAAHPDWSPVAAEIVYQSPASGSWDIYLIQVDGRGKRRLTTSPGLEGLPAWSPDGAWVAYVAFDGLNWHIRAVNRAGTDDRLLFTYDGGFYQLPKAAEPYGERDWIDEQISWSQ